MNLIDLTDPEQVIRLMAKKEPQPYVGGLGHTVERQLRTKLAAGELEGYTSTKDYIGAVKQAVTAAMKELSGSDTVDERQSSNLAYSLMSDAIHARPTAEITPVRSL